MQFIQANSIQALINKSSTMLNKQPLVNGYYGSMATLQLNSVKGTFNLGCNNRALAWGANTMQASNHAALTCSATGPKLVRAKGVKTKTSTAAIVAGLNKWQGTLNTAIQGMLAGNNGMANAMCYPLIHNNKVNYKWCSLYVQYNYNPNTNKLGLIINYRAQHIYMLAFNIQYNAMQLMANCINHNIGLGNIALVCNHHHTTPNAPTSAITGKINMPWVQGINNGVKGLIAANKAFYHNV
jgi:hypothetical protein